MRQPYLTNAIKCLLVAYIGSAAFIFLGSVAVMAVGCFLHNVLLYNNFGFKVLCQFVAHAVLFGPLNALLMMGISYFKRHPSTFGAIQWAIVASAFIALVLLRPTRLLVLFYMVYAFPALLVSLCIMHRITRKGRNK